MPPEEKSVSEVDSGETDALITNFEDAEQHDRGVVSDRGRGGSPNFGYLEGVSTELEQGQATVISAKVPIHRRQHQILNRSAEERDASAVVALDTSARIAQNVSRRSLCPRQKC